MANLHLQLMWSNPTMSRLFWCGRTNSRTCTSVLADTFTIMRGPARAASLSVFTWVPREALPISRSHKRKANKVSVLTWSSNVHTALFIAQFHFPFSMHPSWWSWRCRNDKQTKLIWKKKKSGTKVLGQKKHARKDCKNSLKLFLYK